MFDTAMEFLINKIDRFNERYAFMENEKAVFSIEYAEFRWSEAEDAGCFLGNRYGLLRMARDLMLIAAVSGATEDHSSEYASRFEEGSDEIIILKKRPAHNTADNIQTGWNESWGFDGDETLCLEKILDSMNGIIESFADESTEHAKIEWNGFNKAAFIIGTAFGLVLLAREFIQFALSASLDESYEVSPLHNDSGRLVLVMRDCAGVSY